MKGSRIALRQLDGGTQLCGPAYPNTGPDLQPPLCVPRQEKRSPGQDSYLHPPVPSMRCTAPTCPTHRCHCALPGAHCNEGGNCWSGPKGRLNPGS